MLAFARAFRAATGEPISFIHADLIWADDWRSQLTEWQNQMHAEGIGLGVIIDGDNQDPSDLAWANKAVLRYGVMRNLSRPPSQIIFQSWMARPSKTTPDNEPGTLSSIVVNAIGRYPP
jgi:hypothetical protein